MSAFSPFTTSKLSIANAIAHGIVAATLIGLLQASVIWVLQEHPSHYSVLVGILVYGIPATCCLGIAAYCSFWKPTRTIFAMPISLMLWLGVLDVIHSCMQTTPSFAASPGVFFSRLLTAVALQHSWTFVLVIVASIIAAWRVRRIPVSGTDRCGMCGYSLLGLPTSSNCPECGSKRTTVPRIRRVLQGRPIRVIAVALYFIGTTVLGHCIGSYASRWERSFAALSAYFSSLGVTETVHLGYAAPEAERSAEAVACGGVYVGVHDKTFDGFVFLILEHSANTEDSIQIRTGRLIRQSGTLAPLETPCVAYSCPMQVLRGLNRDNFEQFMQVITLDAESVLRPLARLRTPQPQMPAGFEAYVYDPVHIIRRPLPY